jgi:serine/threonine protein kinase
VSNDSVRSERYELGPEIGAGGTAEVRLATARGEQGFQRPVAVKRVRAERASEGRSATAMIEEALVGAELSHPNVVSILDLERDQAGKLFLVMEYVDGVNLAKLTGAGPVPYPVVIFVVRELLAGLGYLHEARGRGRRCGLVHRDVTPRNVLLSREGEVKLADLGLAQMIHGTATVESNACMGTPGYMSPEQVSCQELDGRSDLYAVGIVLWEMLARRRLRVGPAVGTDEVTPFESIPRPSTYRHGVPADLEAVAMRLLAFDRKARYRTAALAARALARCGAVPRDGRAALVRMLEQRFPRPSAQRPSAPPPAADTPGAPPPAADSPSAPSAPPSAADTPSAPSTGTLTATASTPPQEPTTAPRQLQDRLPPPSRRSEHRRGGDPARWRAIHARAGKADPPRGPARCRWSHLSPDECVLALYAMRQRPGDIARFLSDPP